MKKTNYYAIISRLMFAGLLVCVLCSCSIIPKESFQKTVHFDLNAPAEIGQGAKAVPVRFRRFSANCPEISTRMAFRSADGLIEFDEFHRWAQLPEKMIERYFTLYFNSSPQAGLSIDAILYGLTADLETKKVRLILKVSIEQTASGKIVWSKMINQEIPVEGVTAANFAKAAAQAVDGVCRETAAGLQEVGQ